MAKKENNQKNYSGRENWETRKRENRPRQTWTAPNGEPAMKKGEKGAVPWEEV